MGEEQQKRLQEQLFLDLADGVALFRTLFNQQLSERRFQHCWSLLGLLQPFPGSLVRHTYLHAKGVLLFHDQARFDEAEQIWRALLMEPDLSPLQQARTANALGILLGGELAQWDEADHYYRLAVQGYTQAKDRLGLARVYNNLGILHTYRYEQSKQTAQWLMRAQQYHHQAIQICEQLLDEQGQADALTTELLHNWHGLGRAFAWQARYADAVAAFDQLFALCQPEAHEFKRAAGFSDLAALVHLPQQNFPAAEQALTTAINLFTQQAEHLYNIEAITRLGHVFKAKGQMAEAATHYEKAVHLAETMRQQLATATTQAHYRAVTDFVYTAPLTLHLEQKQAAVALTAAEAARARVLVDLLASSQAAVESEPLAQLRQQRDALRVQVESSMPADVVTIERTELETALHALDRQIELLTTAPTDAAQNNALTEAEIRAALPPDAILLTYVTDAEDRFHALVATATTVIHIPLSTRLKRHWLEEMLAAYLDGRRKGLVVQSRGDQLATLSLFPQLYQALVEPVLPYLEKAKTLYIIPTGPLNYLPIGALTAEFRSAPPLLANRRVIYAPSATVLFRYCHTRLRSPHQGVIALAPAEADLPLSQAVAVALGQGQAGRYFINEAANRQTFLTQTGSSRIVCFLGHALFNAQYPMLSHLKLSDGRLQASEILHELRLDADLVVLAACETGRGQILRGDEILGLSRSLLSAGTPALLVTAWKVHVLSTRLFIEYFFALLTKIEQEQNYFDPAGALAATQNWLRTLTYGEAQAWMARWPDVTPAAIAQHLHGIWTLQERNEALNAESKLFIHPFFWAPYMLIGEPAPYKPTAG